ncbi:hypothetical protein METBIDRAFT_29325 [Metschnikowia bicuspidata var. bicuspidata NRRL YB-4993]|uniref:DNA damage-binding protein 1 n=1 Tax=Metschnikowia bicuspidata var. bicuspidata NRRL YB-4993 TaxID=869754 RepID=A0A1A0HFU6_9ASCO|nr:hypothetical protein METBIDRAFT_29325 [Metschnikowia bicuspidata var. bicuspidata NRRL YB-4993]OBA22728.1 hypothetical protein METBIDRAFT_29325 [Metschnikowia bicuspidata var. bicuspidata NRRL YB-4993]
MPTWRIPRDTAPFFAAPFFAAPFFAAPIFAPGPRPGAHQGPSPGAKHLRKASGSPLPVFPRFTPYFQVRCCMLPESDALYLYHLTLRGASGSLLSVEGQFSGARKVQELVVSSTTGIIVYRPNATTGKLQRLRHQTAFANLQALLKIRVAGSQKDLLVLTSDAGNLTVAEFDAETSRFVPVVQQPYAKSGLSRISPGHYMAADPHSRAIMVAALEKTKLVYRIEPGTTPSPVSLSLPLDASVPHTLTLSLCALDTGLGNPAWAALEIECPPYSRHSHARAASLPMLCYYELDAGLNHVMRRRSRPDVPASANLVVPMPDPVGGVLVCCDSFLILEREAAGGSRLLVPLPVRAGSGGTKIVAYFVHRLAKNTFFVLLHSSAGDLYKLTVADAAERHPDMAVSYFDSVPACSSITVFKSGFLYAHTLHNNKLLYQIEQLGVENDTTTRAQPWSEALEAEFSETACSRHVYEPVGLQNLALVDIVESLEPLTGSSLVESAPGASPDPLTHLVTLSLHSYMKSLVHGMPVLELVASPLPMAPTAIHATKTHRSASSDLYLVLSSALDEKTCVLSIGEVVEEVADSAFLTDQHTLAVQQMGASSVVQIHRNGIRSIRHVVDASGEISRKTHSDWYPPAGITVLHATCNNEQVAVALSNREVCYFEIDPTDDQLSEYLLRFEVSGGSITALAITCNPIGERKSFFLVVGASDETVQVLSLSAHNCFDVLTLQALSCNARSLLMLASDRFTLHVHMGLESGVYVRVNIDTISGKLTDTRLKYLGSSPVYLRQLRLPTLDQPGILALSSRPWVGYFNTDGSFKLFPLVGCKISSGTSFYSDDIGTESVVGISGADLTIFTLGTDDAGGFNANDDFVITLTKLRYTPKKHVQENGLFYVLESDHNVVSPYASGKPVDEDYIEAFGLEQKAGSWASCIQVVHHATSEVSHTFEFDNNECAMALCLMNVELDKYLVVSTTKDLNFNYSNHMGNYLYTFVIESGTSLKLHHKTTLDKQATALEFLGDKKLLVAAENQLRVYELGKKQFLRKSSTKVETLRRVNKIKHVAGDIVVVGDAQNSLGFFQYDSVKNQFTAFMNDITSRQVTTFETLDSRTVIGGDKFGNIFVNRIPQSVFEQMKDNVLMKFQDEFLNGPAARTSKLCEFYIQDIPTSFQKGTFVVGGTESIIYTGLQGTVGILMPLATKHEVEFMLKLENAMRKTLDADFSELSKSKRAIGLVGRDHIKFRGYYNPGKNVIDGDFIEKYYELDQASKIRIAGQLDRAPREIERRLYDLRNRAAF